VEAGTVDPSSMAPVNAIAPHTRTPARHAAAYLSFSPWRGRSRSQEWLLVDFLGMTIPHKLYCNAAYNFQVESHAIRTRQCAMFRQFRRLGDGEFQSLWPVVSEEYFEYADVLSSVADYPGGRPYVFVELGSGYGHWTLTAHRALVQRTGPVADHVYVLVDVLDSLAPTIGRLARLNGLQHYHYHVGFVAPNDTMTPFMLGRADDNMRIYGQDWGVGRAVNESAGRQPITMHALFRRYNLPPVVDMVDLDVQNAEYALLDDATVDLFTAAVKRVHIGTHLANTAELTPPIIRRFQTRGWTLVWNFDHGHRVPTPYGPVKFGDGVLSFVNPRLAGA